MIQETFSTKLLTDHVTVITRTARPFRWFVVAGSFMTFCPHRPLSGGEPVLLASREFFRYLASTLGPPLPTA